MKKDPATAEKELVTFYTTTQFTFRIRIHINDALRHNRCYTHDARPGQIFIIVPLMSWGQVVKTVEVLQESSQERDRTRLLH